MGVDPLSKDFLIMQRVFQLARRIPTENGRDNAKFALRRMTLLWGL